MKAGDLKHPILLQKPQMTTDAKGNRITSWVDQASVMASMADVSGRDLYAALANQAEDTVTFGIRYRDDIDESWRILWGGQVYTIRQVNHLGYKRDFIHLKTRKIREGA